METQIIELEKKYWQGMENHDYETVKKLTRFPCIITSNNGVQSVDEDAFKKMFESGDHKIKVIGFSDVEAQSLSENAAVIAYKIELGMEVNKQENSMKCVCTSTWVQENNNWVCVMHTETELTK